MRRYIGWDNGSTGSIAILGEDGSMEYFPMPVKKEQSYTKKRQEISRIDVPKLIGMLSSKVCKEGDTSIVFLERPMVNPMRFKSSASALRCLEASLIVLETLHLPYYYLDSKEWQRVMLPQGTQKEHLKPVSFDMARRLYPHIIPKGDGDSLLIATYAKQKSQGKISDGQKTS